MPARIQESEVVTSFIDGFKSIQRFGGEIHAGECDGTRYLAFPNGRRSTRFTHEFFPHEVDPDIAIKAARSINAQHHLISLLRHHAEEDIPSYLAAGYEHWGNETLMVRDLTADFPSAPVIEVRSIADLAEGERICETQRTAGLPGHPVTAAHLNAPDVVHRWIECEGQPAAFGRFAILTDTVYLSDVVTLPNFRRRGFAEALMKQLLIDARETGAMHCVLTSSEMGHRLYRSLGFVDVLPLVGFQTPL